MGARLPDFSRPRKIDLIEEPVRVPKPKRMPMTRENKSRLGGYARWANLSAEARRIELEKVRANSPIGHAPARAGATSQQQKRAS